MPRRMKDAAFRDDQYRRRFEPNVAGFNRMIESWAVSRNLPLPPLVPAHMGGSNAQIVCIFQDPGPMAGGPRGSGFISWENDDPSAERQQAILALLKQVRSPKVLIFRGGTAHRFRRLLDRERSGWSPVPSSSTKRWDSHAAFIEGDHILETYHPSRQALRHPDPEERLRRESHIEATYLRAASLIGR